MRCDDLLQAVTTARSVICGRVRKLPQRPRTQPYV